MDIVTIFLVTGLFIIVFSIGVMFTYNSCPVKTGRLAAWKIILLYSGIFALILAAISGFSGTISTIISAN
jgi:hypothetical protein